MLLTYGIEKYYSYYIVDALLAYLLQFTSNIKDGTQTHYVHENGWEIGRQALSFREGKTHTSQDAVSSLQSVCPLDFMASTLSQRNNQVHK